MMKISIKTLEATLVSTFFAVLAGSVPAQALTFTGQFIGTRYGDPYDGQFTITTTDQEVGGYYTITNVTGELDGEAIFQLNIPGQNDLNNDNLITPTGQLSPNGFGFEALDPFAEFWEPYVDIAPEGSGGSQAIVTVNTGPFFNGVPSYTYTVNGTFYATSPISVPFKSPGGAIILTLGSVVAIGVMRKVRNIIRA
jgi:hypothetical protein